MRFWKVFWLEVLCFAELVARSLVESRYDEWHVLQVSETFDVEGNVRHRGGQGADKGRGGEKERPPETRAKKANQFIFSVNLP